jgi:hypothetical protein
VSIVLTRAVPERVREACRLARRDVRIPVVCPRLVVKSRIVGIEGLWGPETYPGGKLYLLTFNNGYYEPGIVHWIVGLGTPQAVATHFLSDRFNEVKGKPRELGSRLVDGRRVRVFRFPDHPAGGPFGGHIAALVRVRELVALASIHGYENEAADVTLAVAYARLVDHGR